jgi:hypothetical protein
MIANVKELEVRILSAKRFLNNELTQVKANPTSASFTLSEIGALKDSIHEVERRGLRNLSDTEFIKIRRVLTSLEARMRLSAN